ncbi:MAG: imidazole glycerol-phosphate synthase subunit HisH [Thermoproteota archaeon]|nr:imidazole glycerol-phosphate synthase subunit HisH [Thermoproteota archaeon]
MPKIVIIDSGLGNIRSVQKGIEKTGCIAYITTEAKEIREADALILPGVGAFRDAINNIRPLSNAISEEVNSGKPLLGICLGLQLLFTESTEGGCYEGLNVLKGKIIRLPDTLKVPHMGWNSLKLVDFNNPIVREVPSNSYVYFVHSYYAEPKDQKEIVALTDYGVDFASIVSRGHVFATQFHPEKSGKVGLRILRNFVDYVKR